MLKKVENQLEKLDRIIFQLRMMHAKINLSMVLEYINLEDLIHMLQLSDLSEVRRVLQRGDSDEIRGVLQHGDLTRIVEIFTT